MSKPNTMDDIGAFLETLKVHNKDLDACFNDAVAVLHLEALITAKLKEVDREARISELELLPAWNNCNCQCLSCKVINRRLAELRKDSNANSLKGGDV